ncbi:hypothetical protein P7D22_22210 [Lichenihabitans sp. Uapishka_5]|uniref:hypothetical protein n=1 Tax=Lichenihabitans sp. Uapishka_5 TaxID=3037302 RepID=UPI0029E7F0B3|nr:hypothetical protein [Lichenihabitans sp. Uapishka_5]MDX7953873.1 hypothetical protein [Lichenihabitans sp. Uapishka_5]
MTFQLVRASDDEIAVWQTEHGHIYGYGVCAKTDSLTPRFMRDAPDAVVPARDFIDAALAYATREAQARQLIGQPAKAGRRLNCSAEPA